ncbi:MAG: Rieske 2Fe-2S domain-containing protein [Actinobacteria bacterium]|nr:Rieske 2Fe-2S domain-containing protein [Actinomycetota bacterium]
MSISTVAEPLTAGLVAEDGSRVSRRLFFDDAVYEEERRRIFERTWLFVGHESQIPDAGDFIASSMGEEPVLVSRGIDGSVSVVVNSCTHRGTKLCDVDRGNASTLTCPYHGWQFALDGRLLGVPRFAAYLGELDKSDRSLHRPRVETFLGLIFATFDLGGPTLREYLGDDLIFYLEATFDRDGTGTSVVAGIHRWHIACNWKLPCENQAGDLYHPDVSHVAALSLGGDSVSASLDPGVQVTTSEGHAMVVRTMPEGTPPADLVPGGNAGVDWFTGRHELVEERLGAERSLIVPIAGNVFPNFSMLPSVFSIRVNHPRGPMGTEVWAYCLVPSAAPPEVREQIHGYYQVTFGPGGLVEEEDGENWIGMTNGASTARTDPRPLHIGMGLGTEYTDERVPGSVAPLFTEHNQREFYKTWQRWMDRP